MERARRESQAFTVAIADSLEKHPQRWSYDGGEKWIMNHDADLQMSAPQTNCITLMIQRIHSNGMGSTVLADFHHGTSDRWLLNKAYGQWVKDTALERERDRETWKAKAIVKLAA